MDCIKPWHIVLARKQRLPTIFLVAFNIYDDKFEKLLSRRLGILYATQDELTKVYKFYQKLDEIWRQYKNARCNSNIFDNKFYSSLFMGEIYRLIQELTLNEQQSGKIYEISEKHHGFLFFGSLDL